MPRSEAQQRLVSNWLNIVLTIISVTQGFVTGDLLSKFPAAFDYSVRSRSNLIVLVLFLVGLVISLRVFQTIITGVLDEEFTMPDFPEFFLVFIIVSVEYYLFSLFELIPSRDNPRLGFVLHNFLISFYKWGIALSVIGALGYSRKLWLLKRRHKTRSIYYYRELWLQRRNIFGMLALVAIQFFLIGASKGVFNFSLNGNGHIPFLGVMIAVLFANINYSLWSTFGEEIQESGPDQNGKPSSEKLEIEIIQPKKEHVAELRNLLVQHFGYVYEALFCNKTEDKIIVPKMLEPILKSFGGRHALGYKSFWIARDETEDAVGILLLKKSGERWRRFLTTLSIAKVVFLNFGLRGLFRVWRKWRDIRGISQKVRADELHIVYLAVSDKARKRHVGKRLLEHARLIAREKGKDLITLCVRKNNTEAKGFFLRHGFEEIPTKSKAKDKADEFPDQGPIIRMLDAKKGDKSDPEGSNEFTSTA